MSTAKRVIDANELRTQFDNIPPYIGLAGSLVQQYIDKAPTVDAVEVVRCMDCNKEGTENCPMVHKDKLIGNLWAETKSTDFCSYGERRSEENET